jgi:hypothetical protein
MNCLHAWSVRPCMNPGNRVTGAGAACRRGFSRLSLRVRLHFTKGYPNG